MWVNILLWALVVLFLLKLFHFSVTVKKPLKTGKDWLNDNH